MNKNKRNLYRILHVQPDAPVEIIRASFRTLMQTRKAHPDLGGSESDAQLLNHAYDVLSNEHKRRVYDANLTDQRHPAVHHLKRIGQQKPLVPEWNTFIPPEF